MEAEEITVAPKSTAKSTEFMAFAASFLTAALNKKLGLEIPEDVMMAMLGMVATYIAGRSWVKRAAAAQ